MLYVIFWRLKSYIFRKKVSSVLSILMETVIDGAQHISYLVVNTRSTVQEQVNELCFFCLE